MKLLAGLLSVLMAHSYSKSCKKIRSFFASKCVLNRGALWRSFVFVCWKIQIPSPPLVNG
jgi:hypothetical protein